MKSGAIPPLGFGAFVLRHDTAAMLKITWAHVAMLFLIVVLILGVTALVGSEKDLELKASTQEFVLKTKPRAE